MFAYTGDLSVLAVCAKGDEGYFCEVRCYALDDAVLAAVVFERLEADREFAECSVANKFEYVIRAGALAYSKLSIEAVGVFA